MKTELKKVYYCDYCKKHGLSAGSISRHERFCKLNPVNKCKCFNHCVSLKKSAKLISPHCDPESSYSYKTTFTCMLTGQKMYSYLLEKKANFKSEYIKDLVRMPLECNLYKEMSSYEIERRYNPEQEEL